MATGEPAMKKHKEALEAEPKEEWNLDDGQIQAALQLIAQDQMESWVERHGKLALFLYVKGIYRNKTQGTRVSEFKDLLDNKYPEALDRLKRIVEKGEDTRELADGDNTFTYFVNKHPEWGWGDSSKSYVSFRDDERMEKKGIAERVQHSGLCYMHAPVVLQHYCVAREAEVGMLDMAQFLRKHRTPEMLATHIFDDVGDNSVSFLKEILEPGSNVKEYNSTNFDDPDDPEWSKLTVQRVVADLKKYGAGLVARFRVDSKFMDKGAPIVCLQYAGPQDAAEYKGLHAMLLVGHRKTEDDEDRFLIQNWWQRKPFVEVDIKYLVKSESAVVFVTTPQTQIPSHFPTNDTHLHAELEMNLGEQLPDEMCSSV